MDLIKLDDIHKTYHLGEVDVPVQRALYPEYRRLQAGISRLLLMHLPPFRPGLEELLLEAQAVVPGALLANDGADVSGLLR